MVIVNEKQYQEAKESQRRMIEQGLQSSKYYEYLLHSILQYEYGPHEMMQCECNAYYYPLYNLMQYVSWSIIAFLITMLAIV